MMSFCCHVCHHHDRLHIHHSVTIIITISATTGYEVCVDEPGVAVSPANVCLFFFCFCLFVCQLFQLHGARM